MYILEDIKVLRKETGMSMANCKKAFEYANEHKEVTPIGYLKAISFAVSTPELSFLERCKKFSEPIK